MLQWTTETFADHDESDALTDVNTEYSWQTYYRPLQSAALDLHHPLAHIRCCSFTIALKARVPPLFQH